MQQMTLYIAITSKEEDALLRVAKPRLSLTYKISPAGALLSKNVECRAPGGVMGIICPEGAARYMKDDALCDVICYECGKSRSTGAMFITPVSGSANAEFLKKIAVRLAAGGDKLFLPCDSKIMVEGAVYCVSSAVTDGSLYKKIDEAVRQYGAENLALDIDRLRTDYVLPCPPGYSGNKLSAGQADTILEQTGGMAFFSADLGASYITYVGADGASHFLIFDDARSINYKLHVAEQAGIKYAFAPYGEIADISPELGYLK